MGKRSGFIRTSGTFSWADTSTSCILNRMCRLNGAAGQGVLPAATQFPIERNALYDEATPNPPKDTDGRREESGRVRELQGSLGSIWGREVGGRSSSPHRGPYAGAAMRGMAREYAAGNSLGPGWRESAGTSVVGGWVGRRRAVRPGVEWLAAGPRRG